MEKTTIEDPNGRVCEVPASEAGHFLAKEGWSLVKGKAPEKEEGMSAKECKALLDENNIPYHQAMGLKKLTALVEDNNLN
jgi:hypothetical protein